MKEIDFLPTWYKHSKRKQRSYRAQYIALGGLLVVMVVWQLFAHSSLSNATAKLTEIKSKQTQAALLSKENTSIKAKIAQLREKADLMDNIDSRIQVADVLAEMSFLISQKIVLRKMTLDSQRFSGVQSDKKANASMVRAAGSGYGKNKGQKLSRGIGDVRFKIVINGIAVNAHDVADLICKMEDSPYFTQVYPSYSRNAKVKTVTGLANSEDYQLTEFEISCYLANYRKQEGYLTKK